jgi:UV excision repair protein RAD23
MGEEQAVAVANMEAMGFPRESIHRAMRAAFFNPDRAVDYLLNGIPAHLQREDRPAASPAPRTAVLPTAPEAATTTAAATEPVGDEPINLFEAAAQAARPTRGGGGSGGVPATDVSGALDFLRNNAQFQQLRQVVQQQPHMLEVILQQLGNGNPQLAQLIASRPEEFLQLLAEDGPEDAALPPGAQAISVTEEEREAIERVSPPDPFGM